jgi:hypothetical protein
VALLTGPLLGKFIEFGKGMSLQGILDLDIHSARGKIAA